MSGDVALHMVASFVWGGLIFFVILEGWHLKTVVWSIVFLKIYFY